MIYFKSLLVGIASALAASVIYLLVVVVLPVLVPLLMSWIRGDGGIGAVSVGFGFGQILGVTLVGFAIGFYWEFRRASKFRPQPR